MRKIKEYVDLICEELEGAKVYAEMSIDFKVQGQMEWANKFKEAANDELKHANYIHELAVGVIAKYREKLTPPQDMLDKWEKAHAEYIEKAAWIKTMLSM